MKVYKFDELENTVQVDIIYNKLLDIQRMGLLYELSEYIVENDIDLFDRQIENELYDINGVFMDEVE